MADKGFLTFCGEKNRLDLQGVYKVYNLCLAGARLAEGREVRCERERQGRRGGVWVKPKGLPARNETRGVGCREGWEAEQVSVAEAARERGDASSERQRTWRSLERGPGRRA